MANKLSRKLVKQLLDEMLLITPKEFKNFTEKHPEICRKSFKFLILRKCQDDGLIEDSHWCQWLKWLSAQKDVTD